MVIQATPTTFGATPTTFRPATAPTIQPRVEPELNRIALPVHSGTRRTLCPRCDDTLVQGFNEPECLQCGYVHYGHVEPVRRTRPTNLVSAGTRYVLRYVGDSERLTETLAYVRAVRLRNRAVYEVTCPFCEETMEQSSLSGKRRDLREERFKCLEGHRVSLTPGKKNSLGWK